MCRTASYILEADTGGWDECFPSVAPCDYPSPPWAGAHIQDHGELWSQPAALEVVEGDHEVRLRTRWQGVVLPYTFERTISLAAGSAAMRMEYVRPVMRMRRSSSSGARTRCWPSSPA